MGAVLQWQACMAQKRRAGGAKALTLGSVRIETKFYTIELRSGDTAVWNVFADGSTSRNPVPEDDGQFAEYARQCGFTDPYLFNLAHEAAHAICAEVFFDRPSYVVKTAASGKTMSWVGAGYEERLIAYIQRAAVGVLPVIDPLWQVVIDRLRELDLCGDPAVASPVKLAA